MRKTSSRGYQLSSHSRVKPARTVSDAPSLHNFSTRLRFLHNLLPHNATELPRSSGQIKIPNTNFPGLPLEQGYEKTTQRINRLLNYLSSTRRVE